MKTVMKDIFFEVDVQYSQKLHDLQNDLSFLLERIKIEKVEKLVANLHEKKLNMSFTFTLFKAGLKAWASL